MITNFQSPNLQREIIQKKNKITFFKFSQLIYSSSSISRPSLKFLAVILFLRYPTYKIALLAFKGACSARGVNSDKKKIRVSYFLTRNP